MEPPLSPRMPLAEVSRILHLLADAIRNADNTTAADLIRQALCVIADATARSIQNARPPE